MDHRLLGRSGFKVSELTYGNWVTHGSQIEEDAAAACVHAALDCGITSFDTADVYARGRAEEILGRALKGQPRAGLEIFTKVYGRRARGPTRAGSRASTSGRASTPRCAGCRPTTSTCTRRTATTTRRRSRRRCRRSRTSSGRARRSTSVSPNGRAEEIREAKALAEELGVPLVSNQPQYSASTASSRRRCCPTCRELGLSQSSGHRSAQGVLTGKYQPGQAPPAGSRATDEAGGAKFISRLLRDDVLERVQQLRPLADEAGLSMAGLALAWVLQEENVASAIIGATRPEQVRDNVQAVGVRLDPALKQRMDEILAPVTETDPALTKSPNPRG